MQKVEWGKWELLLAIFTLIAATFISVGGLFFTVKHQGDNIDSLQTELNSLDNNIFTNDHALRDFKFVKDDENVLYQRIDSQMSAMNAISGRRDQQVTFTSNQTIRINVLEGQMKDVLKWLAKDNKYECSH